MGVNGKQGFAVGLDDEPGQLTAHRRLPANAATLTSDCH